MDLIVLILVVVTGMLGLICERVLTMQEFLVELTSKRTIYKWSSLIDGLWIQFLSFVVLIMGREVSSRNEVLGMGWLSKKSMRVASTFAKVS
jgi:hypothetical protein